MKKQVYKNRNALSEIILIHCLTFRAKMHTGKSSIYLPCLSYETAKVHVISVRSRAFVVLSKYQRYQIALFFCFHFLEAPRHFQPRANSGRETLPALNF